MNNYIKHIVEEFDFNAVNKQKKNISYKPAIDDMILNKILSIDGNKLYLYDKNKIITPEEQNYLKSRINSHEYGIFRIYENNDLPKLIWIFVDIAGNNCDLNCIDVSRITNMSFLFHIYARHFNGDISKWDVSNVTNMQAMFSDTDFNGDISKWDVSNVINMHCMFTDSKFNSNISEWDVGKVRRIEFMFKNTPFKGDLNNWNMDISKMTFEDKYQVFDNSPLEKNPPKWYYEKS